MADSVPSPGGEHPDDDVPDDAAVGDPSSLATLPPWDGSQPWPEPDPNQVGSGWGDLDDVVVQRDWSDYAGDPAYSWGDWDRRYGQNPPPVDGPGDAQLAATYDELAAALSRIQVHGESDSDSSGELTSSDGGLGSEMSWFQDYLEFVIVQRACATTRRDCGLPPVACTRHAPCATCRLHDGYYVPSAFWYTMSDPDLDRHLAQYLRVRDQLPAWQPRSPGHAAPPPPSIAPLVARTAATSSASSGPTAASPVPAATPALSAPTSATSVSAISPSSAPTTTSAGASPATTFAGTGGSSSRRSIRSLPEDERAQIERRIDNFALFVRNWSASLGEVPPLSPWARQLPGALRSSLSRTNGTPTDGNFVQRSAPTRALGGDLSDEDESGESDLDDVPPLISTDGFEARLLQNWPRDWVYHPLDCACQRYMRAPREQ